MASPSKATGKTGKKDARPRTPPEKKRLKASEEFSSGASEERPHSPALKGEDIQALAIRPEDLDKLRAPQPPGDARRPAATTTRVLVRKPRPPGESRRGVRAAVARPLPQDAAAGAAQPLDYTGPGGPRFDAQRMVLPHSIVGSLEVFRREMEARGEMELASRVPEPQAGRPLLVGGQEGSADPPPPPPPPPPGQREGQSHALQHWRAHMSQRRRQQDLISKLLQRPAEALLMNQADVFRETQEQRELIARSLPTIQAGHGHRVGSEFWSAPQRLGDERSGIAATLSRSQRGQQGPLTHTAKPRSIRLESGQCGGVGPGRSWNQSPYLQQRRQELRDILDFNPPEIDGLEVIGSGRPLPPAALHRSPLLEEEEEREELREAEEQKENRDPLAQFDDVIPEPVLVPALRFCGHPAHWTGSSTSHQGAVGVSARVCVEAWAGEGACSHLELVNDGSSALYYSWQRLPPAPGFTHTHTHTHAQHFYFNTSTGVVLPGDALSLEVWFRSARPGVRTEAWRLNTHPALLGGASLELTLRGVALHRDGTAHLRLALQRELQRREAESVCRRVLSEVLGGVATPERPTSPAELYTTEEERFLTSNPKLQYHCETVGALKSLWQQVTAAGRDRGRTWDLSVSTLRQAVLALPQGDCVPPSAQEGLTRDGALAHYSSLLLELARPRRQTPPLPAALAIGLQLWRELVDGLVRRAMGLRHVMGLPDTHTWTERSAHTHHQDGWGEMKKEEKCEKKGGPAPKEEKKGSPAHKEEKKSQATKTPVKEKPLEERPPSKRRGRAEEGGRGPGGRAGGKEAGREPSSSSAPDSPEDQLCEAVTDRHVDPQTLDKYRTQLTRQVCVLMEGLVDSLCDLLDEAAETQTLEE